MALSKSAVLVFVIIMIISAFIWTNWMEVATFFILLSDVKRRIQEDVLHDLDSGCPKKFLPYSTEVSIFPAISLRGDFDAYERRGGMYLQETMHFESLRFGSFFGITISASCIRLSAAGFYATGNGDETRCYSCGIRYKDWLLWDKPQEVPHNPDCLHKQGRDPSNVPFQNNNMPFDGVLPRIRLRHVIINDHDLHQRLEEAGAANYEGIWTFKIPNYKHLKVQAVLDRISFLSSKPFYSCQYGYKMCLKVYLNGDGVGRSTHLSVFLVIMKGDYDLLLPWPFTQKVKLSVLDQSNEGRHLNQYIDPEPSCVSFRRPQNEMNIPSGSPRFVRHSVLEDPGNNYLKDDTIFIKN